MASVLVVWLIGLVLIFAEFYVPGTILAIIGTSAIIISLWMGYQQIANLALFVIWVLMVLASIIGTIWLALWRLETSGEGTRVSSANQQGYLANRRYPELIGQRVYAVSDLRPAGWIDYEGTRLPAMSQSGFIAKGSQVLVVDDEGGELLVRHIPEEVR